MSPHQLYQNWLSELQTHFIHLKAWQVRGLALLSLGVVLAESSRVSKISEHLGFAGNYEAVQKRLKRLLNNPRIDVTRCCECWVEWVWSVCELDRAILLVDETKLGHRIGVMMVSLAFGKRAIPLMWRCYRANSAVAYPEEGQVAMIVQLLTHVMAHLPAESRPLIQADRGIGCSSRLMRACEAHGWHYLFRLQKSSVLTQPDGTRKQVWQLAQRDEIWCGRGRLFNKPARYVTAYVFVASQTGQLEPWYLASNDPTIESSHYAVRMWQELSFKDLKSAGWQWQASYIRDPQRMTVLLLALTLAYGWMLAQGTQVTHDEQLCRDICGGDPFKYSLFRAGLRYFRKQVSRMETVYTQLCFVPRYKPIAKSVPP